FLRDISFADSTRLASFFRTGNRLVETSFPSPKLVTRADRCRTGTSTNLSRPRAQSDRPETVDELLAFPFCSLLARIDSCNPSDVRGGAHKTSRARSVGRHSLVHAEGSRMLHFALVRLP